jgi:glycine/D-amino acid oxidase-like deaminating enzyme
LWFEGSAAWKTAPVFLYELPEGVFYGFPSRGSKGVKIAEHTGGVLANPDGLDRALHDSDLAPVQAFVEAHLMGINGETPLEHSICMYTMSPDEHFCVGAHPAHPGLFLAAGLSGHGFKFAPVLGEALAQLAMTGHAEAQIDFLSPARFQAAS